VKREASNLKLRTENRELPFINSQFARPQAAKAIAAN